MRQMAFSDDWKPLALGKSDAKPSKVLDRIPVQPRREDLNSELAIKLGCTEFTCRCPVTGQPDWATIDISYQPDLWLVESKSMKLYLESYRDEGIFHEHLAQTILEDFVSQIGPLYCYVTAHFNTRGGIAITAKASYYKEDA